MKFLFSILLFISVAANGQFFLLNQTAGSSYDADAQTMFNNVTAGGGTLTSGEKTAINDYVLGLKAASLWTDMSLILPYAGTTATTQKYPLKNNNSTGTGLIAFGGTYTHSSLGAKAPIENAAVTSSFLLTNIFSNNLTFAFYTNEALISAYAAVGINNNSYAIYPRFTNNNQLAWKYAGVDLQSAVPTSAGMSVVTTAGNLKNYKNGSLIGTGAVVAGPTSLGAVSFNVHINGMRHAFVAVASRSFTAGEVATFSTLTNTLMTAFGRNVY